MQLSQRDSTATADLCNELLNTLDCMTGVVHEIARGVPDGGKLRLISALLVWCSDARANVVEIKSLL